RAAWQAEPGEAGVSEIARVGGGHRVAAEAEEAQRAALEAIRRLLAQATDLGEIVAITGALEERDLFLDGAAGQRIARGIAERDELRLAGVRDRKAGHEFGERLGVGETAARLVGAAGGRLARDQHVAAEGPARKKGAACKPQRGIERALERGLEALHGDAEVAQQALGDLAVIAVGRIDRVAAPVADHATAVERELVALGVAAEIIVVVEHQDARGRPGGAAIEPGGRKPADAATDHDEVVALLDRQAVERETGAARLRVRGLERARVLAAQSGQRRRIARGLGRDLGRRREPGANGPGHSGEEVAARNRGHAAARFRQTKIKRKATWPRLRRVLIMLSRVRFRANRTLNGHRRMTESGPTAVISRVEIVRRSSLCRS